MKTFRMALDSTRPVLVALLFIAVFSVACKTRNGSGLADLNSAGFASNDFKSKFIESFEYVDFFDMVIAMNVGNPNPWTRYDNDTRYKRPMLEKWREAKKVVLADRDFTKETLLKVFRVLREKGDGKFRRERVVAGGDYVLPEYPNEQGFYSVTPAQVKALNQNPYLVTTVAETTQKSSAGTVFARHEYPSASTWRRFAHLLSANIKRELTQAEAAGQVQDPKSEEFASLTSKIIDELVTELFSHGRAYSPAKMYQYLISIHPFDDSNGRTTRIMYFAFAMQRPLFIRNFDLDLFSTVDQFNSIVNEGTDQYKLLVAENNQEFQRATAERRMPDHYSLDVNWLLAANRIDLFPKQCPKRDLLVKAVRAYFNDVEVKKKIDRKDFIVIEKDLAQRFGKTNFDCP